MEGGAVGHLVQRRNRVTNPSLREPAFLSDVISVKIVFAEDEELGIASRRISEKVLAQLMQQARSSALVAC